MLPLPVQLTPPNLPHQEPVAASLLRHCFSRTRDRQTPWTNHHHKRRGMALAKPPSLFFNVQNAQKIDRYLFYFILPKIPAEIFCKNILQYIYFAKISGTILCQNIPKDMLPKYSERYFARISHQIFCQNIPPNILPEYPARYFGKNFAHKISCQNSHKDLGNNLHHPLLVHIKSLPGAMISPGPSPSERVPAMVKIAFKAMHNCSLLSGIWKTC